VNGEGPSPLLVDTDVFSIVHTGRDDWKNYAKAMDGRLVALAFPTVGELLMGAYKAGWGDRKVGNLRDAIDRCVILRSTDEVIDQYARIHARFKSRLKGGGVNDIWIAACALAQPRPIEVLTRNVSDFGSIADEFPLLLMAVS
jgi:predicted nucleic acid-binding protein